MKSVSVFCASSPGHNRWARACVTTTACVRPSMSVQAGARPRTGMRSVSKKPGAATGVDTQGGCWPGGKGRPSRHTTVQPVPNPSSGTVVVLPTLVTFGSDAIRSCNRR